MIVRVRVRVRVLGLVLVLAIGLVRVLALGLGLLLVLRVFRTHKVLKQKSCHRIARIRSRKLDHGLHRRDSSFPHHSLVFYHTELQEILKCSLIYFRLSKLHKRRDTRTGLQDSGSSNRSR